MLNSWVNENNKYLGWRTCARNARQYEMLPCHKYDEYVADANYGDDALESTNDEIVTWFNALTQSEAYKQFGMEMTPASKDGELVASKDFFECTFLKQGFRRHHKHGNFICATLNKQSIQELTNWISNDAADEDELLYTNLDTALRFAYFWGREYFDEFKGTVNGALLKVGMKTLTQSFDDFDDLFISKFV
jgi:hypothetical protein